jgi:hypothetical protein
MSLSLPEPRPLDLEEIERLVREVVENPGKYPTEARLLLTLKEWRRQGESYIDEQRINVIYGEAEEIILETFDEGYPYRKGAEVVIIPKTLPTIVVVEYRTNTVNPPIDEMTVYVFTREGWKKVRVY